MNDSTDPRVCFCLDIQRDDFEQDVLKHGRSRLIESVLEAIKQGICECKSRNPSGSCCLGDLKKRESALLLQQKCSAE